MASGDPAAEFTVVTLNMHGVWPGWWRRERLLLDQLAALAPDIVALQEVAVWWPQARWLAWRLGRRRPGAHFRAFVARKQGWRAAAQGLAILSRLPMERPRLVDLGNAGRVAQVAAVTTETHARVVLANAHLSHGGGSGEERLAQARALLAQLPGAGSVVLAGDFNAQPSSRTAALLAARFRSAHAAANGSEPSRTAPAVLREGQPGYVLDYVWVSAVVEVVTCAVAFGEVRGRGPAVATASDHLGIVARLRAPVSAPGVEGTHRG
ncbi:MAG: endonuclease/exonuclease/phosphatase family protein [Tepidiformaceae bacterium]